MKCMIGLIFSLCVFISYSQTSPAISGDQAGKLSWLTGTWNRTNTKPGRSGHEKWSRISDKEYVGYGVNMRGTDTAFVEKIKIQVKDNTIYYVADVPENKEPVFFKFISLTNDGFICENPGHDFPKKIEYKLTGDKLKATISGDGKAIDYFFEKAK